MRPAAEGAACFRFRFKGGKHQFVRILHRLRSHFVKELFAAAAAGPVFDIPGAGRRGLYRLWFYQCVSQRGLLRRFRFAAKDAGFIRAARGFAGRRERDNRLSPHVVRHGVDAETERVGGRFGIGGKHAVIVFQRLGPAVIGRVQIDQIDEVVRSDLLQVPDTVLGRLRVPIAVVAGFGAGSWTESGTGSACVTSCVSVPSFGFEWLLATTPKTIADKRTTPPRTAATTLTFT